MKREEKSAQARRHILESALCEFAAQGYAGASLNAVCAKEGISKGNIYHYFKDKDALYLACVAACFEALTAALQPVAAALTGAPEAQLRRYFDARLSFFAEHPLFLGMFTDAALSPPASLAAEIARAKSDFDQLNIQVLTRLLESAPLRPGITVCAVVEDFSMYMDYFNTRFQAAQPDGRSARQVLREHEERCHRQLDILLHGVLGDENV